MAKQRQTNSIVSAISAVTAALKLESIPNPTEEQKQEIHEAKVSAANVIENSNFMTLAEMGDDSVETTLQVEDVFNQAGIDPVEFARANAVAGAGAVVALEQARQAKQDDDDPETQEDEM